MVELGDLVQEFKRTGRFDSFRKQLLEDFTKSPSGQQLRTSLCRLASETEATSKAALIGALGKSNLFNAKKNGFGSEIINSDIFKDHIRESLRKTYDDLLRK